MVETLAFKIFLYAGCLTLLEGDCWPCKRQAHSIKKFYFTKEPIWTLMTSGHTNIRCLVDRVNAMEKKSVFFTRCCYNRGYKVCRTFEGIFVTGRKKHMEVKNLGKGMNFQEDLLYATDDYRCSVVMVTTTVCGKYRTYDLRIRGAYIVLRPPPKCLEHYRKFERHGTVLYERNCTDILKRQEKAGSYEPQNDRCGNRVN
uniref:Lipocalin n=1 Tax=Rhipicephalus zambeziensis TaxID=60191 RepID=A0A224YH76_9ACAR